MEKQNLMSSLRRLSSAALLKKLKEETREEHTEAIIVILKARNVEIPQETASEEQKSDKLPLESSLSQKLNALMDEIFAEENTQLNLAIGEIFPSKEISEMEDSEIEALIKQIEYLRKKTSKKKEKSKLGEKPAEKEVKEPHQNKKQLILDLIASGKTRKEISQMKVVSPTYLSKFYVKQ